MELVIEMCIRDRPFTLLATNPTIANIIPIIIIHFNTPNNSFPIPPIINNDTTKHPIQRLTIAPNPKYVIPVSYTHLFKNLNIITILK